MYLIVNGKMPCELHHASDKFLDDSVFNLSSLVASEAHS